MGEFVSKNYKRARKLKTGAMGSEDYLRIQKMCAKCNFFIDNRCSKQRIIRKCAEQGLKNRE